MAVTMTTRMMSRKMQRLVTKTLIWFSEYVENIRLDSVVLLSMYFSAFRSVGALIHS